jgi:hypothetical protein
VNVGSRERVLSVLGGGALALYGLRRSLGSLILILGGGTLVSCGLTGHYPVYQAMGIDTASQDLEHDVTLAAILTVHKPAAEVYRFWRQIDNHPRFLWHIAIDRVPERQHLAKTQGEAMVLDYQEVDVHEALKDLTTGPRPSLSQSEIRPSRFVTDRRLNIPQRAPIMCPSAELQQRNQR